MPSYCLCSYKNILFSFSEKERESGRGEEEEGKRGSEAGSMLSMEPVVGLDLTTLRL